MKKKKIKIKSFNLIDFTGCTKEKAIKALKQANWNIEEAANIILDI